MKLELHMLWSPDLNPPSEGLPPDVEKFDILMQASLGEAGGRGGDVFSFRVCSPSALCTAESGTFVTHTLVLQRFEWSAIEIRIKKLIRHVESCKDWECVIRKLSGAIRYADEE